MEWSHIEPIYKGINIKGSHLLFKDLGLQAGLFLQASGDGRIFFLLPWQNYTLLGTTESLFEGDQDDLQVTEEEVEYLLSNANAYLKKPLRRSDIVSKFAGLRWLALEPGRNLHATTRSHLVSEHRSSRGLLLTLYGGKLTAYRHLSRLIVDDLMKDFGEDIASKTHLADTWATAAQEAQYFPHAEPLDTRFG